MFQYFPKLLVIWFWNASIEFYFSRIMRPKTKFLSRSIVCWKLNADSTPPCHQLIILCRFNAWSLYFVCLMYFRSDWLITWVNVALNLPHVKCIWIFFHSLKIQNLLFLMTRSQKYPNYFFESPTQLGLARTLVYLNLLSRLTSLNY